MRISDWSSDVCSSDLLGVAEVDRLVSVIFDAITNQLAQGGRVELRGFGAFSTRAREGRVGRNPRTGDAVTVPPKRVPYFRRSEERRDGKGCVSTLRSRWSRYN